MNEHLIILEPFQHQVKCCCSGQTHQHALEFRQGDIWLITKEAKFIDSLGWYILIVVNGGYQFFIHVEDVEALYNKGSICSILDFELKILHLNFKVNEALDTHDRESFFLYTDELNYAQEIKNNMNYTDAYAFQETGQIYL